MSEYSCVAAVGKYRQREIQGYFHSAGTEDTDFLDVPPELRYYIL